MRLLFVAVGVKLSLQQDVDRCVEIERKPCRPREAGPLVVVEKPRTVVEKFEAASGIR